MVYNALDWFLSPKNGVKHMSRPRTVEALGQSDAFLHFQERLSRVAAAPGARSVLLVGERGTGKELAAARLHYLSTRWQGPLVALNCAALAPTLLDSELFGHEAGAFTGAAGRRKGRFELADGGTLFLDEIAQLSLPAQEKILRAVEYGEFERVGGSAPVAVSVRVVGATNADLPALAAEGRFKRDLLDRLGFEVLTLPPLREREGDVELLAAHFAARMGVALGHPWPGNVRELRNVVERAVLRAAADGNGSVVIRELVFDPFASPWRPAAAVAASDPVPQGTSAGASSRDSGKGTPPEPALPLKEAVAALERERLAEALARARHNQRRAAALLGLTYDQFRGLYRKHADQLAGGEEKE
jgi:psp operon transcriptional activator